MALYRVHFLDHGENVYAEEDIEHDDEEMLIEELTTRHSHGIGAGFVPSMRVG